jgi:tripartite-type tricarboxylate transporter receptor subunit TctC
MNKEKPFMDRKVKTFLSVLTSVWIVLIFAGPAAQAQSQNKFPTRSIDIIVPTGAGGGADVCSRLVAEHLKKRWGAVVNVVNKPGGNTIIGNAELHRARPDGYTVMADGLVGTMLLEIASRDLPFKVLDRTFIAVVAVSPMVIFVPAASPIKNLKDLDAEVKKDPEHFTWASLGGAGPGDFLVRQFFKEIGVDVAKTKAISTRGGAEQLTMVAGGHVKMAYGVPAAGLSHVRAGTVRAVAVTGYRVSEFPDAPTTKEQGYPQANILFYQGYSGPPKMPASVLNKWSEALQQIAKDQEFVSKAKDVGLTARYFNSDDTRELVRKGMEEARILWGIK